MWERSNTDWRLQQYDKWCYTDTVTLSVTHNHTEREYRPGNSRQESEFCATKNLNPDTTLARMN